MLALADEHVIVHGYVEDIAPYMDGCRVSVAPLRYGAGVKGKVNMAMSYGLPVVATPVAVEGMHVESGEDVLVADDAQAFADAVIRAHEDEALWNRLSANGLGQCAASTFRSTRRGRHFSAFSDVCRSDASARDLARRASPRARRVPRMAARTCPRRHASQRNALRPRDRPVRRRSTLRDRTRRPSAHPDHGNLLASMPCASPPETLAPKIPPSVKFQPVCRPITIQRRRVTMKTAASSTPASSAIAMLLVSVAPGLNACSAPNNTAENASAIQLPRLPSTMRNSTPRISISSVTAAISASSSG